MSAPSTLETVTAKMEAQIARARVIARPFPHLVLDDALPPALRRAVDEAWPSPEAMRQTNFGNRRERLVSRLAHLAEGRERVIWRAVHHALAMSGLAVRVKLDRYLADKFRPLIGPDWRRRLGEAPYATSDAQIAEYRGRIELDPHVDHARIVVNGFIYLDDPEPAPPEPRRGTTLYHSNGFAWPSNLQIPPMVRDRFLRPVKEVGWRDNRLLAYVNGPWSFHGVDAHDLGDARRRILMFGSLLSDAAATAHLSDVG